MGRKEGWGQKEEKDRESLRGLRAGEEEKDNSGSKEQEEDKRQPSQGQEEDSSG